jgi:ubiquinone biosynthesis protein
MSSSPDAFVETAASAEMAMTSARHLPRSVAAKSGSPSGLALSLRAVAIGVQVARSLLPAAIVGAVLASTGKRRAAADHMAERLVALLERLGPAFIKGGQILSTRRDVISQALCARLCTLQDSVMPMSAEQTRETLAAIYGPKLDTIFAEIDYEPVASGSIACVYRGRLADGQEVAIKLQRPAIDKVMATDLALITRIGAFVAQLPWFREVPVRVILDHLCEAIHAQLDFVREAKSLERLRVTLSSIPRVWVPRLQKQASRDRALVMEFIPELDLTLAERCPPTIRKRFAAGTLGAVYRMLFVDGFVHCDLHPGNLYFKQGGQVVVLDAGFSVQLTEKMRRLFAEFFLEMAIGRGWRCAEIVIESAAGQRPDVDLDSFRHHLADLINRNSGLPAQEFSLIAFATEMFDLQRKYGLHAAPELVFPLLSLLVIEGTVRDLDPEVDFQETAKPILTKGIFSVVC